MAQKAKTGTHLNRILNSDRLLQAGFDLNPRWLKDQARDRVLDGAARRGEIRAYGGRPERAKSDCEKVASPPWTDAPRLFPVDLGGILDRSNAGPLATSATAGL